MGRICGRVVARVCDAGRSWRVKGDRRCPDWFGSSNVFLESGKLVMTPQTTPARLTLHRDARLEIDFKDGHRCEYSISYLRTMCPCASCKMVREGTNPHDISP